MGQIQNVPKLGLRTVISAYACHIKLVCKLNMCLLGAFKVVNFSKSYALWILMTNIFASWPIWNAKAPSNDGIQQGEWHNTVVAFPLPTKIGFLVFL